MSTTPLLDEQESLALGLVGALVITLLIAVVVYAATRGPVLAKPAPTALAAAAAADTGGLRVETAADGVVKLYFDTAKHEVGQAADAALSPLAAGLSEGRSLVISGFHDASGDPALNAELAKQRALAVQAALLRLGAKPEQLQLQKPLELTGSGDAAEARRVEVVLR